MILHEMYVRFNEALWDDISLQSFSYSWESIGVGFSRGNHSIFIRLK